MLINEEENHQVAYYYETNITVSNVKDKTLEKTITVISFSINLTLYCGLFP